tara:strand:- start:2939 stop:3805 length:867 start_codon:yes stop_codon:yes gene_type:complete
MIFPASPSNGAQYSSGNVLYQYNSTKQMWARVQRTLTTANVTESNNFYFTNARSRQAISVAGYGSYNNVNGVITITTPDVSSNAGVYSNVILLGYTTGAGYATNTQLSVYATNAQLSSYLTVANAALKANVVDLTTANVAEVTNLYYTAARARGAISVIGAGSYDSSTGVINITGGGGGGGSGIGVINMRQAGQLTTYTGTLRWYAPYSITVTSYVARLATTADSAVLVRVYKNGNSIANITVSANASSGSVAGNVSMVSGDYLTISTIQVGSAARPGNDLYVQMLYQ